MRNLFAILAFILALITAPHAHADDDEDTGFGGDNTTEQICLELDMGRSMGQIAGDLQAGDGRWNGYQANLRVWNDVILQSECG